MARARKGKSSKSNNKSGGTNTAAIFVIAAILVMLVIYAINNNPDWKKQVQKTVAEQSDNTSKKKPEEKKSDSGKSQTSDKRTTPSPTPKSDNASREKFDEKDIDALDGDKETVKRNENLPVYTKDDNYYYSLSFDFTWPAYTQNDAIVEHQYYTLKYNEKTEQADWVAYRLKKIDLNKPKVDRTDNFRMDPDVKTKSASTSDYKGSGYDRGHLAPAGDFAWSKEAMSETFYMSNMSPQEPGFNRGIWKTLESKVRDWAVTNDELFIVCGPITNGKGNKIGKNKVVVPEQYYKVVLELTGKEVKGIGFILKNEKSSKDLSAFAMSIDDVEKATGLDFFPSIPDQLENQIEATYNYSLWK